MDFIVALSCVEFEFSVRFKFDLTKVVHIFCGSTVAKYLLTYFIIITVYLNCGIISYYHCIFSFNIKD